jgi:hypothetical protein
VGYGQVYRPLINEYQKYKKNGLPSAKVFKTIKELVKELNLTI